jgi:hypothetical protein
LPCAATLVWCAVFINHRRLPAAARAPADGRCSAKIVRRTGSSAKEPTMSKVYEVPVEFAKHTRVTAQQYASDYARSVKDPDGFWGDVGRRLEWSRPFTKVKDTSFHVEDFHIRWYADGELNVSANCLDRHLKTRGDKTAIL